MHETHCVHWNDDYHPVDSHREWRRSKITHSIRTQSNSLALSITHSLAILRWKSWFLLFVHLQPHSISAFVINMNLHYNYIDAFCTQRWRTHHEQYLLRSPQNTTECSKQDDAPVSIGAILFSSVTIVRRGDDHGNCECVCCHHQKYSHLPMIIQFLPQSSSYYNPVGCWFRNLTQAFYHDPVPNIIQLHYELLNCIPNWKRRDNVGNI